MRIRSSWGERLYLFLNLTMILVYGGCGLLLLIANIQTVPSISRKLFGGLLLLYAAYRGFKLYKRNRDDAEEN